MVARIKPHQEFLGIATDKIPQQPKTKATKKQVIVAPSKTLDGPLKETPVDKAKKVVREERAELHRKKQFVSHYLTKPNATKAAILAGYSPASADVTGSRLLKDAWVKEKIESTLERMQVRTEVTLEKVLKELALLGMSNMGDYVSVNERGEPHIDLSDLSPEQWAAVAEVYTETEMRGPPDEQYPVRKVKIKLHDKLGSLDKIARLLGGYKGKGSEDLDGDSPSVTNYTLQIGSANIVVNAGEAGTPGGTEGGKARILTLP